MPVNNVMGQIKSQIIKTKTSLTFLYLVIAQSCHSSSKFQL